MRTTTISTDILSFVIPQLGGPGSSVGIATDYGLDDPGSNPGGDEIFRLSRPALRPTQPPVQWVFPGGKFRPGRAADHTGPVTGSLYLYLLYRS